MRYMLKIQNGEVAIYSASGLTRGEEELALAAGWTFYWTTDRTAHRDGLRLARTLTTKAVAR